jgi:hypothetical protein
MNPTIAFRKPSPVLLAFLMLPLSAYSQITLTGAIQFSTNSSGASGVDVWNTLGGDNWFDLWLALNSDASSPVNGPSDDQAGIAIPLEAGNSYKYYIFGAPGSFSSFNGVNLFFDGNNSTPGISAFGAVNTTGFRPNSSSSTFTLQATFVAGSGTTSYSSGGRHSGPDRLRLEQLLRLPPGMCAKALPSLLSPKTSRISSDRSPYRFSRRRL